MALMPVAEARSRLLKAARPFTEEFLPLAECNHRFLSADVAALRTQPPFPASAMDGYAVRAADLHAGAKLKVIGESAAGRRFQGLVGAGEAVRIFTGAPVPEGADTILIQENVADVGAPVVTALQAEPVGRFIRSVGLDFRTGDSLLPAGTRLDGRSLALAASMGHAGLKVWRKPRIGILATGDELVMAGQPCGPDQIIASNTHAVAALVLDAGGLPVDLGIAGDSMAALAKAFDAAEAANLDALITLGGASVGDHDLVQPALLARGMQLDFWKIAMRPGKPLMSGRLGGLPVLGLPGNPVSSIVCGLVFVQPLVRAMAGDPQAAKMPTQTVVTGRELAANDGREDYLRIRLEASPDGLDVAMPFDRQDSSMMLRLVQADALLIRPPFAPAAPAGSRAQALLLGTR
jgi:molybdopterin molybdotransferase